VILYYCDMSEASICEEPVYQKTYMDEAEKLRNHLYYKCGNMEVAQDVLQDSFLKLWKKCNEVVFGTVKGFLYTVAGNLLKDHFRAQKTVLNFEKEPVRDIDNEDPYFLLRTREFRAHIETAISELPDGQREAFLMNRIDKLSYREIAERLGVSQTAVEKRMSKALVRLKAQIAEFKELGI